MYALQFIVVASRVFFASVRHPSVEAARYRIRLKSPSSLRVKAAKPSGFSVAARRCNAFRVKTLEKRPECYQVITNPFDFSWLITSFVWASYIPTATAAKAIFH